jgi:hypothetical protein
VSDNNEDFLSFEKALRELKMRSEELKKLVSEGEIRAFRDGDSMKFRRDDIKALGAKAAGDAELSFADSLEDDTGMVTEQISDEDTLLADDDAPAAPARGARGAAAARPARAAAVATAPKQEPGWVTGLAIVGFLLMVYGALLSFSAAKEAHPEDSGLTSLFAKK